MASELRDNPLRAEDCQSLNAVLETAARHKELLQRCKNCGLPVDDHIARNEQHIELAGNLKREFFPNEL